MIYLLAYDITLNRLRSKIAKRLIAEGYVRLQLSVFAGNSDPKANAIFWTELKQFLAEESTAKFYVLRLTERNFKQMYIIGKTDFDMDYICGTRHTMFI